MSDEPNPPDDESPSMLIDYPGMVQRALRAVVRDALETVATSGLPGDHHFVIDFATGAPGVMMPDALRREHPETIRIVLQHQFWNLEVRDDAFAVDLRFGGRLTRLEVPWTAIVSFVDPAAEVGLQFDLDGASDDASDSDEQPEAPSTEGQVVSIDAFRKNR